MKVVTSYVAVDGRSFDTEKECLEYEEAVAFSTLDNDCKFVDYCGHTIPITKVSDRFGDIKYVFVKTDEAAEKLQKLIFKVWRTTPWDYAGCVAGAWKVKGSSWISLKGLENEVAEFRRYAPTWID